MGGAAERERGREAELRAPRDLICGQASGWANGTTLFLLGRNCCLHTRKTDVGKRS